MAGERGKRAWRRWRPGSIQLSRWEKWATIVGTLIAAIALVVTLVNADGGDSATPEPPSPQSPRLQRVGLVVSEDDRSGRKPALEVLLHNVGTGRSVVSEAKIEVLHVYRLPLCFTQGDLPLSNHYGAQLSTDAKSGEVVETPLHQQLGADEADRFDIALGLNGDEEDDNGTLPGLYLFELDVSLVHDDEQRPLRIGRALVSLPGRPFSGVYYWTRETPYFLRKYTFTGDPTVEEAWGKQMSCWRANTAALRRALSGSAVRSPELDSVGSEIVTPTFAALEK